MRILITLLLCAISSACSIEQPKGLQAIIFEKSDNYSFSLKNSHNQQATDQVLKTLLMNRGNDLLGEFDIYYCTKKNKDIAKNIKKRLITHSIASSNIHILYSQNIKHDLEITHRYYSVKKKLCAAEMIGRKTQQVGCYVDSLRLQQINHPEHLYQPSK